MTYTVVWDTDAEQDLAALWLAAPDRAAVAAAATRIDRVLTRDPLHAGEPWASSVHRVFTSDGLGVEFEVIEDDKRVLVHNAFAVG